MGFSKGLSPIEVFSIYSRYIKGYEGTGKYLSPFRKEQVASLSVDNATGLWYDFGSSEGGDIVDFVAKAGCIDIGGAMRYIEAILGRSDGDVMGVFCQQVRDSFDTHMKVGKKSVMPKKDELEFGIRMNSVMVNLLLRRGIPEVLMAEAGLRTCWLWDKVWLYFDYAGAGYKLMRWETGGKVVLIGGGSLDLWNPMGYGDKFILCEGEIDALTAIKCGYRAASVPMGAGTFKKEWLVFWDKEPVPLTTDWKKDALEVEGGYLYKCREAKDVLIAFDNDQAGVLGTSKINGSMGGTRALQWFMADCSVEAGEDLNSYYMKHGNLNFIREKYGITFDL